MKHVITTWCLLLIATLTFAQQKSANMDVLWEFPGTGSKPDFIGTSLLAAPYHYTCRDIALGTVGGVKTLYVINAGNQPEIHKMDPATGADMGMMTLPSSTLLQQGVGAIYSAAVTEDGMLLVANNADAGKKFNVYLYTANDAAPQVAISYDVTAGFVGYGKISVTGKTVDGTAKLYVTDSQFYGTQDDPQAKVYVFAMKSNGAGGFIFNSTAPRVVTFKPGIARPESLRNTYHNPSVDVKPDGTFIWQDTFWPMMEVDLTGKVLSSSDVSMVPPRATEARYMGKDAQGKEYAAYYTYRDFGNAATDLAGRAEVYSYPTGDLSGTDHAIVGNTTSFGESGLPNSDNVEAHGGVAFDLSGANPVIYIMSINQGIGAYKLNGVTLLPRSTDRKLYPSDNVEVLWQLDGAKKPAFFNVLNNVRTMAFGTVNGNKRLYAVEVQAVYSPTGTPPQVDPYNVNIIDPETGTVLGTLPKGSGVIVGNGAGNHFPLSSIGVTEDGVILVANMARDAVNYTNFKVYQWTSETADPEIAVSYTIPTGGANASRMGDRLSVTGKISDGSAIIWVPSYNGTASSPALLRKFTMVPDGASFKFNPVPVVVPMHANNVANGNNTSVAPLPGGAFLWESSNAIGVTKNVFADGTFNSKVLPDEFKSNSIAPRYIGVKDGYMYYAHFRPESLAPGVVVDYSQPSSNAQIFKFPYMPGDANPYLLDQAEKVAYSPALEGAIIGGFIDNGNKTGDIAINTTGEYPIVYVLASNNGIGAYKLNIKMNASTSIHGVQSKSGLFASQQGNSLILSEIAQTIELYAITGQKVATANNQSQIAVTGLRGVYVVRMTDAAGAVSVQKVLLR